jgi:hypothetical protein
MLMFGGLWLVAGAAGAFAMQQTNLGAVTHDALRSAVGSYTLDAVFSIDEVNSQFELSACASNDGVWKLAPVARFPALCHGTVHPLLPPGPPPPLPASLCKPFAHGPPCSTDADCAAVPKCVRCARSGFCTDVRLPPLLLD